MGVKFSIITPVYNSWNFMKKYWKCLEEQTYINFEIIIIDDCSSDKTYEKVSQYREHSSLNIHIYRNSENRGPGFSRNVGLENAKGEWILFLDSDDYISYDCLEKLHTITNKHVDCIIFDYYILRKNIGWRKSSSFYIDRFSSGPITISQCIKFGRGNVCGKAYRLNVLKMKSVSFLDIYRGEDTAFYYCAIIACGDIYYLHDYLYYYQRHEGSLSSCTGGKADDIQFNAFEEVEKYLYINNYVDEIREASIINVFYTKLMGMCPERSDSEITEYIEKYEAYNPHWDRSETVENLGLLKKIFFYFAKRRKILFLRILAKLKDIYTG